MGIVTKITTPADATITSLNGKFRIERNRAVTYDTDGKVIATNNTDGLTTYDTDGKVMLRSGLNPLGGNVTVIGIEGEDALDNL